MTNPSADDAAFVGRLTAGATHEIRNVLSVIKESAGLMGDLLEMTDAESFQHAEKFCKMITNILAQVDRGSAQAKGLNTLAHATDERMRSVDPEQVLSCQSILYARFCRRKGITLSLTPCASRTSVVTDPVQLHAAVCGLVEVLLEALPSGSDIAMTCEPVTGAVDIVMTGTLPDGSSSPEDGGSAVDVALNSARSLAEAVGGTVDARLDRGSACLRVPVRVSGSETE